MGEGIEKRAEDFGGEVASLIGKNNSSIPE